MSECSGDFYQSHGYFINSAYRGVQLICKLQRLMLSPIGEGIRIQKKQNMCQPEHKYSTYFVFTIQLHPVQYFFLLNFFSQFTQYLILLRKLTSFCTYSIDSKKFPVSFLKKHYTFPPHTCI